MAEVHVLSAGCKAFFSETTQRALHTLREGCGGHGYSAYNRFGQWRNDHDVFLTFEGYHVEPIARSARVCICVCPVSVSGVGVCRCVFV